MVLLETYGTAQRKFEEGLGACEDTLENASETYSESEGSDGSSTGANEEEAEIMKELEEDDEELKLLAAAAGLDMTSGLLKVDDEGGASASQMKKVRKSSIRQSSMGGHTSTQIESYQSEMGQPSDIEKELVSGITIFDDYQSNFSNNPEILRSERTAL